MPYEPNQGKVENYHHIGRVRHFLTIIVKELLDRANVHDVSKLEPPEAEAYQLYTPMLKEHPYLSPGYMEGLEKLGPALEHHYAQNSHHPQFFKNGIKDMDLIDLLEMLADWRAAQERSPGGNMERSIAGNQGRFGYSDELANIFRNTVKYFDQPTSVCDSAQEK